MSPVLRRNDQQSAVAVALSRDSVETVAEGVNLAAASADVAGVTGEEV